MNFQVKIQTGLGNNEIYDEKKINDDIKINEIMENIEKIILIKIIL